MRSEHPLLHARLGLIGGCVAAGILLLLGEPGWAQGVYKCRSPSGSITLQDAPCEDKSRTEAYVPPSAVPAQSYGRTASDNYADYLRFIENEKAREQAALNARRIERNNELPNSLRTDFAQDIEAARRACDQESRSLLRSRHGTPSCSRVNSLLAQQRLQVESMTSRQTGQAMPDHTTVINQQVRRQYVERPNVHGLTSIGGGNYIDASGTVHHSVAGGVINSRTGQFVQVIEQ